MLTRTEPMPRNLRRERQLWHDESHNTPSLGCPGCRERKLCGGLCIKAAFLDCLQFCCGTPETCDRVCRSNPDYVDRVREIGGFPLDNVPRAPLLAAPDLPRLVPVIFHGKCRARALPFPVAALPLSLMFNRRSGDPRFTDHNSLCAAFGAAPGTVIMLAGTDRDRPLERWWGFGTEVRRVVVRALKGIGVRLVTTPNYSLFLDRPRWDDLHAMKRIALVHEEFLSEGMPAALHVNGRTETDFRRWGAYVAARPEITHLAYEFTTGTGLVGQREQHAAWLAGVAAAAGRPLHLIMRGGIEIVPFLTSAFARLTILDTSIFMKTMMRRRAVPAGNSRFTWQDAPTAIGEPLDDLIADNFAAVDGRLASLMVSSSATERLWA